MAKSLVGKYVLENWVNGDFIRNHLRYINRENKKYYISDVQRTIKSYDNEPIEYVHIYKWATKLFKDNSKLGFRRSITHLSNTDGVMTYSVFKSPAECKCKYSFEEVFGNDLRDIQDPQDSPLRSNIYMEKHSPIAKRDKKGYYKIWLHKEEDNTDVFCNALRELFNVKDIYITYDINEHKKESILTKSATLFHIINFGEGKKSISVENNRHNNTILFWLFDDRLVYQHESGKDTW